MTGTTGQCFMDLVVQEGGSLEHLAAFIRANPGMVAVTMPMAGITLNIPSIGAPGTVERGILRSAHITVATWPASPGIGLAAIENNFIIG